MISREAPPIPIATWHLAAASLLGGLLGSAARAGADWAFASMGAPAWTARVFINVLGGFLIGLLFARLVGHRSDNAPEGITHRQRLHEHLWGAGALGGFTTVSGFAWDAAAAINDRRFAVLALILLANAVVGVAACALGWKLATPNRILELKGPAAQR